MKHNWVKRAEHDSYFDCANPGCGEFVFSEVDRDALTDADTSGVARSCPVGRERRSPTTAKETT